MKNFKDGHVLNKKHADAIKSQINTGFFGGLELGAGRKWETFPRFMNLKDFR